MSMRIEPNTLNYYVKNVQISFSVLKTKINHLDPFLSGENSQLLSRLALKLKLL